MRAPLTLFGFGLALGLAAGCARPATKKGAPPPELTLHRVTLTTFRGSERIAVGHAESLTYERTSGDSVATVARLDRLPAANQPTARPFRLDADQVVGNVPGRIADASGHVTVRDGQGLTGVTPRAHFDGPRSLAHGEAPVKLRGKGYGADAAGFKLLIDQDELTLTGPVKSWSGEKR
jgi:hypothetical protein